MITEAQRKALDRTGTVNTPESNLKRSLAMKGRSTQWLVGRVQSEETKRKRRLAQLGVARPQTRKNPDSRDTVEYYEWQDKVFTRDGHTCRHCSLTLKQLIAQGGRCRKLDAHHIKSWDEFPELRYDVDNGLTLCRTCHRKEETRLANEDIRT
jgi:hypothetical protein